MSNWEVEHVIGLIAPRLEQFKRLDKYLWHFRCPICGDSKKDRLKTRAYIYTKESRSTYRFHCHNCNADMKFEKFVDKQFPEFAGELSLSKYRDPKRAETLENLPVPHTRINLDWRAYKAVSTALTDLPSGHPCVQYVASRKLPTSSWSRLYWCDDIRKYGHDKLQKVEEGRLSIPAFHPDKSFQGYTLRDITGLAKTKYLAVKIDPRDDSQMVFGFDQFNINRHAYVCEGPLDSFFFDNGLAVGGSALNKITSFLNKEQTTVIIDNQPRNKYVLKQAKALALNGWRVFIWPPSYNRIKDVNQAIQEGLIEHKKLNEFINNNSFSGLRLELEIAAWVKNG